MSDDDTIELGVMEGGRLITAEFTKEEAEQLLKKVNDYAKERDTEVEICIINEDEKERLKSLQ